MKVLIFTPVQPPRLADIENDLRAMQDIVEGYIETVTLPDGAVIVCNEEGKIRNLMPNRPIRDESGRPRDVICGTFFIAGVDGDEFTDLTDSQIRKYRKQFA